MPESYSVEAILSAVDKNFTRGFAEAEKTIASFEKMSNNMVSGYTNGMKTIAKVASVVWGIAGTAAMGYAVNSAAEMRVVEAQYSQAFEGMTEESNAAVEQMAKDWSILPSRIKAPFASFQTYFKGVGMEDTLAESTKAMAIAADTAAYFDKNIEDTASSLKSYMMGNMTASDALGFNAKATLIADAYAQQYGGSIDDISESARQSFLLEYAHQVLTASGIMGQAAREGDQFGNVLANMKGSVKELAGSMAEPFMDDLISAMKLGTGYVRQLTADFTAWGEAYKALDGAGKIQMIKDTLQPLLPLVSAITSAFALLGVLPLLPKASTITAGVDAITGAFGGMKTSVLNNFAQMRTGIAEKMGKMDWSKLLNLKAAAQMKVGPFFNHIPIGIKGTLLSGLSGTGEIIKTTLSKGFSTGLKAAEIMTSGIGRVLQALGMVVKTSLSLLAPAAIIGIILVGLGLAYQQFGTQIDAFLNMAKEKGPEIITNFANGILSKLPDLLNSGVQLVNKLVEVLVAVFPSILQAGVDLIVTLASGITQNLPSLIQSAILIVKTLLLGIISAFPQLLLAGMQLLMGLVQGIIQNMPLIIESLGIVISALMGAINTYLPMLLSLGLGILMAIVQGVIENLPAIMMMGLQILTFLCDTLLTFLPIIVTAGIQILMALVQGVIKMIPYLIPMVVLIISTFVQLITENLPLILNGALQIMMALFQGLMDNLPVIIQGVVTIINVLVQALITNLPLIISMGLQLIISLIVGIITNLPLIVSSAWEIIKALGSGLKEAAMNIIPAIGRGVIDGLKSAWTTLVGDGKSASAELASANQSGGGAMAADTATYTGDIIASFQTMNTTASTSATGLFDTTSTAMAGLPTLAVPATTMSTDTITAFQTMNADSVNAATEMTTGVNSAFETLGDGSTASVESMTTDMGSDMSDLQATFAETTSGIDTDTAMNFESMFTSVDGSMGDMDTSVMDNMSTMTGTFDTGMNDMTTRANQAATGMNNAFSLGMRNVQSTINSGVNQIVSAVNSLNGSLYSSGTWAMAGLQSGLNAGAGSVYATASAIASNVASTINSALKVNSPSKLTRESGLSIMEGLDVGMWKGERSLLNTVQSIAGIVTKGLSSKVLAGNVGAISGGIQATVEHRLSENFEDKRPAVIHMELGQRHYKAFVEDISNVQNRAAKLEEIYLGG